jgi:hypothetical protein
MIFLIKNLCDVGWQTSNIKGAKSELNLVTKNCKKNA